MREIPKLTLQKTIQNLEQTVELLDIELAYTNQQTEEEFEKHETEIAELETQICQLQEKCQCEVLGSTITSSQKHASTTNIRALHYSLLSMCVPPGQIKSVV